MCVYVNEESKKQKEQGAAKKKKKGKERMWKGSERGEIQKDKQNKKEKKYTPVHSIRFISLYKRISYALFIRTYIKVHEKKDKRRGRKAKRKKYNKVKST